MKIGAMSSLVLERRGHWFDRLAELGLKYTQLNCWQTERFTAENAAAAVLESKNSGVTIAAVWSGYCPPRAWNFTEGPVTLGLVPPEYRKERIGNLKRGADFASMIGAPAIVTHCGFIPENMTDANYAPTRDAIGEVAEYCNSKGVGFWFETGQETPVVLLRVIQEIGLPNLGINLDPANLIMYGKANPNDALEVFGKYVRCMHVKDGVPPVDGHHLGGEVQVGKGFVDFPRLMKKLKALGYDGEFIIEREIAEDENQRRDILETVENLKTWWA